MPAGGEVFIAGQYTVSWNGTLVGIFEGDSGVPTIMPTTYAEAINNTDAYGKKLIDAIAQGSDWEFMGTLLEWKSGSKATLWPFDATLSKDGVIARLYYNLAQSLVMTAITGTPAQVAGDPNTVTASKSILPPGFSTRIPYGPTLRKFALRQALLPFSSSGSILSFVLT